MIVSLVVGNFRSIKERTEFSLVASSSTGHLDEHVYKDESISFGVLRSAGIYGANASGKSNLLMAFEAIKCIATETGRLKDEESIPCYEPYLLSEEMRKSPVSFEIEFITKEKIRFNYKVKFNKSRVIEESLDFYPSKYKANLFKRDESDDWESIKFGSHYKGGSKRIAFFKNNSYLSKAGDNASSPDIIKIAYNYIDRSLRHIGLNEKLRLSSFGDRDSVVKKTSDMLCLFDTGISDITYKQNELDKIPFQMSDDAPQEIKDMITEDFGFSYLFSHETESGNGVKMPLRRESEGTQKLFEIIPLIYSAFENGMAVIIDELDSSLHSHIATIIIRLFNDASVNKGGAQLIFTTHNLNLMAPDKMRRDQVWFCEKNNGKTRVYSLDDFDKKKVKSSTPYAAWYDDGRFGAVPDINYDKIKCLLSGENLAIDESVSFDDLF